MTTTLYRPTNLAELQLIERSNWNAFPPRLAGQPIFYPVTNRQYAHQITVEWNFLSYGKGVVVEFEVDSEYVASFREGRVGGKQHTERWVPAEELERFNSNIFGDIRVVEGYSGNPGVVYYYIEDIFEIKDRGVFVGGRVLDENASFNLVDLEILGGVKIEKWVEVPRKLDGAGRQREDYLCFRLEESGEKGKLRERVVVEIRVGLVEDNCLGLG